MSYRVPQLKEKRVREILAKGGVSETVSILGVRGYFRDTMGEPGKNDVGIYDDAMFLVSPSQFIAVPANTDPSKLGWNAAIGKPYAMLLPGLWYFIRGAHKGKIPALRQADEELASVYGIPNEGRFRVWRKGGGLDYIDEGYYAINIHRGGERTTSSWGCQTIPTEFFDGFMQSVWDQSRMRRQNVIPYLLVDGPIDP